MLFLKFGQILISFKFMRNTTFTEKDRIGIVANDAGAANIIKAWVINFTNLNFYYCLGGPALKIFKNEFSLKSNRSLEDIISKCNVIITGTSYSSNLEYQARVKAKESNILSITFIDHWVNYTA